MIDDDSDEHEIFKMAIGDLDTDIDCLFFADCESALAYFNNNAAVSPAYVVIDLKLPRVNGEQCLADLHRIRKFDHPLIVVYSSSIPDDWRRLAENGVDHVLQKSNSVPELTNHLRKILDAA